MPQHHLYDEQWLKQVGVPTSGDRNIDRELANSEILCQLTIAEMAEKFANGATLTLEDPKKSVEIYETINEHIGDWRQISSNPLGMEEIPVEDLRMLEELAIEIYKIARGYRVKQLEDSKGLTFLSKRPASRFTPDKASIRSSVKGEHNPITDLIAEAQFERSKRWRN